MELESRISASENKFFFMFLYKQGEVQKHTLQHAKLITETSVSRKHLKFPWSRSDAEWPSTLTQCFLVSSFCCSSSISFFNFISNNDSYQRLFIFFFFFLTTEEEQLWVRWITRKLVLPAAPCCAYTSSGGKFTCAKYKMNSAIKSING